MDLNVVKQFTDLPGGRYISQGPNSGEEFRENYLRPVYDYCLENDENLTINLDDGYGYSSGFLEEAFGGMVREGYDGKVMLKKIKIISNDQPSLETQITNYIKEAIKEKKKVKIIKK